MRLTLFFSALIFSQCIFAQAAGAIAIIGYNTDIPNEFTFVVVDDLPTGTTIFFTDNGIKMDGTLRDLEGTIEYTVPAGGLSQGDVVAITAGPAATPGTVAVESGSMSLGLDGDQIIAFTGSTLMPTFITAVQNRVGWKTMGIISDKNSYIPGGLTEGENAMSLNNKDNAQYTGPRGLFTDRAAALAALYNENNWTTDNSPLTLNTTDFAQFLPVNLLSFNGKATNSNILLSFATATEESNSHFLIQRSTDGKTFETIGRVEGKGNSNQQVDYEYTDIKPVAGINYYRLQQFDYDDTSEYFGPIAVRFEGDAGNAPSIWPIPAKDRLEVNLPNSDNREWLLEVYDLNGRRLLLQSAEEKTTTSSLDISQLPAGGYLFRWTNGSNNGQQRFIKG